MTRRNIHVIIVPSKVISKRKAQNNTGLAEVVKNNGTPLPYTEIGICAIIVSSQTGRSPNLYRNIEGSLKKGPFFVVQIS